MTTMTVAAPDQSVCEASPFYGEWVDADGNRHPIERSQKGHFWASMMETWLHEIEIAYGFSSRIYDSEDGRERVIELLGPDSPGEFVMTIPKWKLSDDFLQDTANSLILWADRMGRAYRGDWASGVVPDDFRQE